MLLQDLATALAGQMTPLAPVWSRGPAQDATAVGAWSPATGDLGWRIAETADTQVRVGRSGRRVRVVVARATIPLDHEVRAAITETASP